MLAIRRHSQRPVSTATDPFTALDRMARWFDNELWAGEPTGTIVPSVDVREDEKHFTFVAELPGLTKDDVDVTVENGVLTIKGEKKGENEEKNDSYHVRERYYGRFARSFRLPEQVDSEKIDATLKDGLLTVTLEKSEAILPKKIAVKTS